MVPTDSTLPPPGWYPDPYRTGSQRWFDGSEWTSHALAADTPDPDGVVERDWVGARPDDLRRNGLFSSNDLALPQGSEAPYDGGGDWQGLYANRVGRRIMRSGSRWGPVRASRWLGGLTALLGFCAWGDPTHRWLLAPAAAVALVITVVFVVREAKERAYWRNVGRND